MGDERRLGLDKANEEAWRLHQENPDGALGLPRAIPVTEPNEDPNGDGLPVLEHYKRCLLEGMGKGVLEQKSQYGAGGAAEVHRGPLPTPGNS